MESVLDILFVTHSFYNDSSSRQAVRSCLQTLFATRPGLELLPAFVRNLKGEASKPGIAPSNAFVLLEWCSLLLSRISEAAKLWERCGSEVIAAEAQVLELCQGSTVRDSVKHSALVVARRGIRKLFQSENIGQKAIVSVVTQLTTKGVSNTKNANLLGIVAGVCARLPARKHILEGLKDGYYAFYTRELIGSRIVVPQHQAEGLQDFFTSFMTREDFQSQIVPALEKALLRAPEVILNDLVTPLVCPIPMGIDLSDILLNHLLKPLLANIKSTNANIRTGATNAFRTLVSRCHNEELLERIADEILLPLKQSKVTVVEQRQLHAQILSFIPSSEVLFQRIPKDLAPVTIKEPNEPALAAETAAMVKHLTFGMLRGLEVDASVVDAFNKGLSDKRAPVRRLWAMRIGDLLWSFGDLQRDTNCFVAFIEATFGNLLATFNEIVENPLPSAQSGLITAAYVLTALADSLFQKVNSEMLTAALKKAAILPKALATEPKPSFLLNHRIYSKLTLEEDLIWALRALATVSEGLTPGDATSVVGDAWTQAFLYLITSPAVPFNARREAADRLSEVYVAKPDIVAKVVVEGIWRWRQRIETADRDSAAMAARTGNSRLYLAVRSICLPPSTIDRLGAKIESETLKEQLIDMLVLCRPEILPSVEWIGITLRAGVDPGALAQENPVRCLEVINGFTMVCDQNQFPTPLNDLVP